ncbi:MAG: hypothetical protein ACTSVY_00655 [Candidatus Helarchaeota archaeon]
MASAFGLYILILISLPVQFLLLSQALLGFGIGLFSSPNQSAIMSSVEKKQFGIASGTLSTMRVTGQSISIVLLSSILAAFIMPSLLNAILSKQQITISPELHANFMEGLITALIVTIIICLLGALCSSIRGSGRKKD